MSENVLPLASETDRLCTYPGCTRPRRPDPATGRPSRYCERADEEGGPVHNRATAWKARRTHREDAAPTQDEGGGLSAPVSMARATLDQRLAELPGRVADLRQYLDAVVLDLRAAGDIEAAGSEVEDAHREALTKVTAAEGRAAAAERAARSAHAIAQAAQQDRAEADALTEEATAEMERVRQQAQTEVARAHEQLAAQAAEFTAEMERVKQQAQTEVARAHEQLAAQAAEFTAGLAERDAEVDQARRDVADARTEAASAVASQNAATTQAARERETAAQLRQELDTARRDFEAARIQYQDQIESARMDLQAATTETAALRTALAEANAQAAAAERASQAAGESLAALRHDGDRQRAEARSQLDDLRATHAEQLAQVQRNADERVAVLTDALDAAREMLRLTTPIAPRQSDEH